MKNWELNIAKNEPPVLRLVKENGWPRNIAETIDGKFVVFGASAEVIPQVEIANKPVIHFGTFDNIFEAMIFAEKSVQLTAAVAAMRSF